MDVLILDTVRSRVDSQTQEELGEGVGKSSTSFCLQGADFAPINFLLFWADSYLHYAA